MRQRLFVLLLLNSFAMLFGAAVILMITGTFSIGTRESEGVVQSELTHITNDINLKYSIWSAQSVQMSKTISEEIEKRAASMGIGIQDIAEHPELLDTVLRGEYETCSFYLERSDCSGVFLILDATVNPTSVNAEELRAGIFLTDSDPDSVNANSESYFLLRGFPDIGLDNGVSLHPQWALEFNVEEATYFSSVIANAENGTYDINKLYYWSEPLSLPGVSEQMMLCSVPLIASDGTVFGVCGCEINQQKFKDLFSPGSSQYPRIFTVLCRQCVTAMPLNHAFVCGGYTPSTDEILAIGKKKNSFYDYTEKDGTVYYGYQNSIMLYAEGSPYADQTWQVSVLVRKDDVMLSTMQMRHRLLLLFSLLMAVSILLALLLSKRYIEPIVTGLDAIKTSEFPKEKTNVREIDELLAYLSEHKKELSEDSDVMPSGLLDAFMKRTETLSSAERAVFNLYVQEYTAQEIAEELFLSINTIKTHSKRIYNKLNVGSREEMMLYVSILREAGKKIGDE